MQIRPISVIRAVNHAMEGTWGKRRGAETTEASGRWWWGRFFSPTSTARRRPSLSLPRPPRSPPARTLAGPPRTANENRIRCKPVLLSLFLSGFSSPVSSFLSLDGRKEEKNLVTFRLLAEVECVESRLCAYATYI